MRNRYTADRLVTRNRGQVLVEFALCLPFLVVMLAGIMQLGLIIDYKAELTHAVRRAALLMTQPKSPDSYRAPSMAVTITRGMLALKYGASSDIATNTAVSVTGNAFNPGELVTVTATYNAPLLLPIGTRTSVTVVGRATFESHPPAP